jgi:hypothetical protein
MKKNIIGVLCYIMIGLCVNQVDGQKCLHDHDREQIKLQIEKNRAALIKSGKLPSARSALPPLFDWPMRQADGFDDPGYYVISNYVDHDTDTTTMDPFCGTRTYDGHRGTDVRIVPFRWNKMAADQVEIIAAADGIIILKRDGNQDQNCQWGLGTPWNAIFLEHADGTVTWYGHMKNGSLTQKDSGDVVVAGEFLGIVGSSGNSTGAHLHFEVYDSGGNLIDPFQGNCNSLNNDSWWNNQIPYFDSGINKLMTASQQWTSPACPQQSQTFEKTEFDRGDAITFSLHYRCDLNIDDTDVTAYEPDGDISTLLNLNYQRAGSFFSTNPFAFWSRTIPNDAEQGKWIFEAVYNTTTYGTLSYQKEFWVRQACVADRNFNGTHTIDRYYPTTNSITSSASVSNGTHIVYDPENYTVLYPGFIAVQGSKLEIKTAGCN